MPGTAGGAAGGAGVMQGVTCFPVTNSGHERSVTASEARGQVRQASGRGPQEGSAREGSPAPGVGKTHTQALRPGPEGHAVWTLRNPDPLLNTVCSFSHVWTAVPARVLAAEAVRPADASPWLQSLNLMVWVPFRASAVFCSTSSTRAKLLPLRTFSHPEKRRKVTRGKTA